MGRHSCCYKQKLRKGLWSPEEDEKLLKHITKHGHGCWSSVPKLAGLQRCGKSCRLRWINYLRPDLKRGTFSQQEENVIIELHAALGNRWSQIASQLPGRTDNEIKNYWNSCIKKKLKQKGIDPNTHKPLDDADDVNAHDNEGGGETSNSDRTSSKSTEQKLPTVQELAAPSVQSARLDESPVENAGSMPPMSMKELFLDRYVGHGSCSGRPLDMAAMGCDFPLGQSSFGGKCDEDPTASLSHQSLLLWFNQSAKLLHTNSEFGCSDMLPPSIPSATSSILSAAVKTKPISCFQPDTSLPGDSGNNNVISANNGNGIELHGSGALFDGGVFPWPELLPNKGSPTHLDGVPEDLKWCEYLNGGSPFAASAGQHSQGLYGATKEENQFSVSGLSSWHESKLQSPAGMYSKDFEQRIPPVFEQRIPPVFEQF